jgi:RNA polymerase sigma-70 factor, ECF subfamily
MKAAIMDVVVDVPGAEDRTVPADLVGRAVRGDRMAFDRLVEPHLRVALGAARLITGDEADAADAVQDALLRAWLALPALRDPEFFVAWFRRIVIRSATHFVRRRTVREVRLEADVADRADALEREMDRRRLARAFSRLAPKDRVVLTLHHYWQLPVAESARILDVPEGTVRSRVHHALKRLRAGFDAEERR